MPPKLKTAVRARTTCRLCDSKNLKQVWSFGETPLANSYLRQDQLENRELFAPLVVDKCQQCHLVQLRHVVNPEKLFGEYLYVSSTSPKFVRHFSEYAAHLINRFQLTNNDLVVDVGSNDGILLKHFQGKGIKVFGIEPAQNIAEMANEQGIPTVAEFFTPAVARHLAKKHGRAKVITANNVFAHTDDIHTFVNAAKELLTDDGVFVFEVQYLGDLITNNLFDIVYHEHLCYYHVTPLVRYFANRDLEVFDVERPPVHGGSIRVYVQRAGRMQGHSERLAAILTEEEEQGLNDAAPYAAFAERIEHNKTALKTILKQLKESGARIVGYGAPAKATTLLYAFGIDADTLDYIVDDDAKIKQGLYMPGSHIPIVSPERLYQDKPEYCLILAWNFAEPIMANHKRFTRQGGKFIVPVPEPAIIDAV